MRQQQGFTLIELMIAIGIIAVIATVAIPTYRGYIDSGRQGALFNNIASMEVFQEDLRLRTGLYGGGTYDVAGGNTSLTTNIAWQPQADDGTVYVVVANTGVSYQVTATDTVGTSMCMLFPAKNPCP